MTPHSGEVVRVGAAASVQFGPRPILFRVIRVLDVETYDGWVWLDGYELNDAGDAVDRRSIFVMVHGLELGVLAAPRREPRNRSRVLDPDVRGRAPVAANQRRS